MAVLEIPHINARVELRPVLLHDLAPLVADRFETWARLPDRSIALGERPDATMPFVQFDDDEVARRHVEIAPQEDVWTLTVAGGHRKPTHINGARWPWESGPRPLVEGDEIRFGRSLVRFRAAPELVAADPMERGLLDAIRDGAAGSEDVYLDWLEREGLDHRAELLRLLRLRSIDHIQYLVRYRDLARSIDAGWRVRLLLARDRA